MLYETVTEIPAVQHACVFNSSGNIQNILYMGSDWTSISKFLSHSLLKVSTHLLKIVVIIIDIRW